ncbi:MAG: hypothetical protein MJY49_03050 [Bacteroidales bacterium]|nr:hypothetical protein [Bacteroidales bacterium]
MIKIFFGNGETGGDCITHYDSPRFEASPTLGDFLDWLLSCKTGEWGSVYESPRFKRFEYRWGKIVCDSFTQEERNRHIELCRADGGWSCMDYTIQFNPDEIDKEKENRRKRVLEILDKEIESHQDDIRREFIGYMAGDSFEIKTTPNTMYYTKELPIELVEKLKGIGMPIHIKTMRFHNGEYSYTAFATYADAFDWLMGNGLPIMLFTQYFGVFWKPYIATDLIHLPYMDTWFDAANAGIECAIKMLEKFRK